MPGCPTGGLHFGTEGADILSGEEGEDEVRGLGTPAGQGDELYGGPGNDFLYGDGGGRVIRGCEDALYGGGGDELLGGKGEDVLYGDDWLDGSDFWPAKQ